MTEYLFKTYRDKVNFVIVYVIEPHPHGQICPYTGNFWLNYQANWDVFGNPLYQPDHLNWRIDQAKRMKAALLTEDIPVLVDRMDNPIWCTYGPAPNIAYLIDVDGTVIEKLGWYNRPAWEGPGTTSQMEAAIKTHFGLGD